MPPLFNIAVFLYPGCDILDFSGPLEIYSTNPPPNVPRCFTTRTFSFQSPPNPVKISLGGVMNLVPDATFQSMEEDLENYDILLVPGAEPDLITELLKSEDGKRSVELIKKFAGLKPREETGHRIVQSVCTGAFFLAAAGILANRTVTTHHMSYDFLKKIADEAAGGESNMKVVRKRWMDAGLTEAGVRIVNAGGVTSGLDASLFVVETLVGKESADWTADIVEFERRKQDDGWGS